MATIEDAARRTLLCRGKNPEIVRIALRRATSSGCPRKLRCPNKKRAYSSTTRDTGERIPDNAQCAREQRIEHKEEIAVVQAHGLYVLANRWLTWRHGWLNNLTECKYIHWGNVWQSRS